MRAWLAPNRQRAILLVAIVLCFLFGLFLWSMPNGAPKQQNAGLSVQQANMYLSEANKNLPEAHFEHDAVEAALSVSLQWKDQRQHAGSLTGKILCVTFMQLSELAIHRGVNNIVNTRNECHWINLIYKYDESRKDHLLHYFNELLATSGIEAPNYEIVFAPPRDQAMIELAKQCQSLTQTRHYARYELEDTCARISAAQQGSAAQSGNYNHLVYPKVLLFAHLLPKLNAFPYVWIVDGDISLRGFHVNAFLHAVRCAFAGPVLIAQPLIAQNTQTYKYLNRGSWDNKQSEAYQARLRRDKKKITAMPLAAETGFVEIQVPLIDARLLEWFVLKLVLPLAVPMHVLGADWGFDELFCQSARFFQATVMTAAQDNKQRAVRGEGVPITVPPPTVPAAAATAGASGTAAAAASVVDTAASVGVGVVLGVDHVEPSDGVDASAPKSSTGQVVVGHLKAFLRTRVQPGGNSTIAAPTLSSPSPTSSIRAASNAVDAQLLHYLQQVPTQCAVILPGSTVSSGGVSSGGGGGGGVGTVHHEDSRETNALLGYDTKKMLNKRMQRIVQMAFPTFYALGKGPLSDPLHPESQLQLSYELRAGCV